MRFFFKELQTNDMYTRKSIFDCLQHFVRQILWYTQKIECTGAPNR